MKPISNGVWAEDYAELLEADGSLYELSPAIKNKDADRDKVLDLRVFARLENDIEFDSAYEIDGSEEIIFLLVNSSEVYQKAVIAVDERESDTITVLPASAIEIETEETVSAAATATITTTTSGGGGGTRSADDIVIEDTAFTFTAATASDAEYDNQKVYEGIAGGLSISGNADFTYQSDGTYNVGSSFSATTTLTVNGDKFASVTPGIYHYTVTEDSSSYSGVTTDDNYYDVYVYVLNDGTANYVGYVVAVKNVVEDGVVVSSEKADLSFTNDYGADETIDSTHDLTITKAPAGDLQNASDAFKVTVKVEDANADGQYYQLIVKDANGNTVAGYDDLVEGTASSEITIYKGYTITINGLTESAVVTVTETDTNGYTASYTTKPDGMTQDESNSTVLSGSISSDNAKATLTNTKSATTPTGIILNFAPYILLVAFAGVFAVLFLGKKREEF